MSALPSLRSGARPASRGKRLAKLAFVALLVLLVVRLWLAPTPDVFGAGPKRLADAIALGRAEHKPVLAVATSDFCLACQLYKRGALADERVQAWIRAHAVPSFTRIEWEDADARRLERANGPVPATALLVDGVVVARFDGSRSADELLAWLEQNARSDAR